MEKVKDIVSFIVEKEEELEKSIESAKKYWSSWLQDKISRWEETEKKEREDFEKFLEKIAEERRLEIKEKEEKLEKEFSKKREEYRKKLEENYLKALEFLWEKFGE
ncbi:MAG: hypothetical protein ACPLKX_08825 [Dictyoglomaceae bacterium]